MRAQNHRQKAFVPTSEGIGNEPSVGEIGRLAGERYREILAIPSMRSQLRDALRLFLKITATSAEQIPLIAFSIASSVGGDSLLLHHWGAALSSAKVVASYHTQNKGNRRCD